MIASPFKQRCSKWEVPKLVEERLFSLISGIEESNIILIVDDATARNLTSCVQLSDLCGAGIFLVESITKNRKPYPQFAALYLVSSIEAHIQTIMQDIQGPKPSYKSAYIYYADPPADECCQDLELLEQNPFVKALERFFLSFQCVDSHALHFNMHLDMARLLHRAPDAECALLVSTLFATLRALGLRPHLLYQSRSCARDIALQLYEKFLQEKTSSDSEEHTACDFLIVDRALDVVSPLLYDFSYEKLLSDLSKYSSHQNEKDAHASCHTCWDPLWAQTRHVRIDSLQSTLLDAYKKAKQSCPSEAASGNRSTSAIYKIAHSVSHDKKLTKSIESHLKSIRDVLELQKSIGFSHIIETQQILVRKVLTGQSALSDRDLDDILLSVSKLKITTETRRRIFYLYALSDFSYKPGKLAKFQEAFQIPDEKQSVVEKLRALHKRGEIYRAACHVHKMQEEDGLGRYPTILQAVVSNFLRSALNSEVFVPVSPNPDSKTKAGHRKTSDRPLLVLVLGGFSVSELHDVRKLAEEHQRPVILMGTSYLSPAEYMYQLELISVH